MPASSISELLKRPTARGWLVVVAAFGTVWFGASNHWVLIVGLLTMLPVGTYVCHQIAIDKGYAGWLAIAGLFGPLGVVWILGLPKIRKAVGRDTNAFPSDESSRN